MVDRLAEPCEQVEDMRVVVEQRARLDVRAKGRLALRVQPLIEVRLSRVEEVRLNRHDFWRQHHLIRTAGLCSPE